ncbi:hypothetical protein ACSBR2_032676 [Camellia fascicularis]
MCKYRDALKKDWWCGKLPLSQLNPSYLINDFDKVSLLWDETGRWDFDQISTLIHQQDLQSILNTPRLSFVSCSDTPTWATSSCGAFTTASAYKLISNDNTNLTDRDWK